MTAYWVGVASREHVRARPGWLLLLNHGKEAPLSSTRPSQDSTAPPRMIASMPKVIAGPHSARLGE